MNEKIFDNPRSNNTCAVCDSRNMVQFLIPNYVAEGKNQLVVAIGCTGGKHRSVTIANKLYEILKENREYKVKIEHRDIEKVR